MANNLFSNIPACVVAKENIPFVDAGISGVNVHIIYEVGSPLKSYIPGRVINPITAFEADKGYYIVPKVDLDLSAILAPPFESEEPGNFFSPFVSGIVTDSGLYHFGPIPYQLSDGSISTIFTRKPGHAPKGPVIISRSFDGGASWIESQANVDGTLLEASAHSWYVYPDGGQLILYQDDELYTEIKFAYRAGWTGNFVYRGSYASSLNGVSICPFRGKPLPEGQIRFGFYEWNTAGTRTIGGFLDTDDLGVTMTEGPILYDRTTQATAEPISDWMLNEFDQECIENTGVNATSKFIAIARASMPAEGGTYYTHFKSTGGTVWTSEVATEDAGSFVDDLGATVSGPFSRGLLVRFLSSNSPVCIKLFNGMVYLGNGERNTTDGFAYKITFATVEGAFRNKYDDWAAPVLQRPFNAATLGASIDCGYDEFFEYKETSEGAPMLCYQDYDVSTETHNPAITTRRCWIYQGVVSLP